VAGPSGGVGSGVRTERPRLADLRLEPGIVLFDQWRIVRELGRGGFGAVFEAEELNLGQTQALKVLDPAMVAREELLARFRREVALMRQLVHPRIVRVYDYREDRGEHLALISMEYVAGCAVREVLAAARSRKAPIPVGLALAILSQTLEALAAAHGQGVIHRDVTPGNILLAGGTAEELLGAWGDEAAGGAGALAAGGRGVLLDPQVKLVDFGIAGLVERTELSQKSRVMGTTGYVAPEALDADAEVTAAADVFGAGAVAYELLCGKVPLSTGFQDIAQLDPRLAEGAARVVMYLVAAAPSERPTAQQALTLIVHEAPQQLVTDRLGQPVELECVARRRREQEEREEAVHQEEFRSLLVGMEFVQIPAGSFLMGSDTGTDDEKPVHQVTISRPFELQTTPVTQGQWVAVMGFNPSEFNMGDDYPVENMTWEDMHTFLKKLNVLDPGKNYRLPTEAEWEYACRAGTTGERYGELDAIAWHRGNSDRQIHPVGQKQPNAWGLYDMLGNVWEWCADGYDKDFYASSPATDPRCTTEKNGNIISRGGTRSAQRHWAVYSPLTGFRCARG